MNQDQGQDAGADTNANANAPGLGLGAFFSLMSASFAYEDPLSKASQQLGTKAQTAYMFKEMGRNMWSTGKGFAKVGALYSGIECCIEGVCLSFYAPLLSPPYELPPVCA